MWSLTLTPLGVDYLRKDPKWSHVLESHGWIPGGKTLGKGSAPRTLKPDLS